MDFWIWGTAPMCKAHGLAGKVHYSYARIAEPSIQFSIQTHSLKTIQLIIKKSLSYNTYADPHTVWIRYL